MSDAAPLALLGGLDPGTFLRRYWQKRALLVTRAIPDFKGIMPRAELFALAGRDDVESRVVLFERGQWTLLHGPFSKAQLKSMPERAWTLLVQGVNLHHAEGDALLRRFAFIPYARVDDLMISYAAPGGGVGPHVDSYDVFLLQGTGRRRWRVSQQADLSLREGLPLKILRKFRADAERTLDPGDMLYLPPRYAHDGIAIDACTTYSIGFRAPSTQELGTAFLDWLRDGIRLEGAYADPGMRAASTPARIDPVMRAKLTSMLSAVRWTNDDVARFIGCYLTEPKLNVTFMTSARRISFGRFAAHARRRGVHLDMRSQLLYDEDHLFVNGDALAWPRTGVASLKLLANDRHLASRHVDGSTLIRLLYDWYRDGFLHID